MLKIAGCIIIFICSFALGNIKALSLKERRTELENILELIKLMELEITYRKEPLIKTFKRTSALKNCWFGSVLEECSDMLIKKASLNEAWETAIGKRGELSPLEAEDIAALKDLVLGLGKSDADGQKKILVPVAARLESNMKKAEEREEKLGRMYKALGTAAGIVIVIMII